MKFTVTTLKKKKFLPTRTEGFQIVCRDGMLGPYFCTNVLYYTDTGAVQAVHGMDEDGNVHVFMHDLDGLFERVPLVIDTTED